MENMQTIHSLEVAVVTHEGSMYVRNCIWVLCKLKRENSFREKEIKTMTKIYRAVIGDPVTQERKRSYKS